LRRDGRIGARADQCGQAGEGRKPSKDDGLNRQLSGLDSGEDTLHIVCMNTPRMTISLTAPQLAYLREEAARLGITVADLVRRIIDQHREGTRP
jgi:hypothetical protein